MGKGSSSGSNTAVKQARSSSTGTEGGGQGQGEQTPNGCLFQFSERLIIDAAGSIKVGDTVALVQNAADQDQLDIYIGSARYGQYTGQHLQKILTCMSEKYSYSGAVTGVTGVGSGSEVACTIKGHSYEQSTSTL